MVLSFAPRDVKSLAAQRFPKITAFSS